MKQRVGRMFVVVVAGTAVFAVASIAGAAEAGWSYSGTTGPTKWAALSKEFKECKAGEESKQSPIDIQDAKTRKGDLPGLLFNYKTVPLKVVDDGHTIKVNYPSGSLVSIEGKRYELTEINFHKPAEEKVDGKGHDMDAHLVHKGPDGKLMVLAVLMDAGKENKFIKSVWDNLPKEKGKETSVDAVKINAVDLLPTEKGYYTYAGSLTTPPCTEQVTWYVLKTPIQVSSDQISRFGRIYPNNARPIQPFNDRDVMGTR